MTVRKLTLLLAVLTLVIAACATEEDIPGETGILTPEPTEDIEAIDDPASTPHEGHVPDSSECNGEIGAVIMEEIEVPDGASCTLDGTTVEGNVRVGAEGTLEARSVAVDGDVQAEGALAVNVANSTVEGNIQLEGGGSSSVINTAIDGDLQWEAQAGTLEAVDNTIDGNLQASDNTGGLTIRGNTITGNLECEGNDPAPDGGDNEVDGDREDQCAEL